MDNTNQTELNGISSRLEMFTKAKDKMIGVNTDAYKLLYENYYDNNFLTAKRKYTPEEVNETINSNDLRKLQQLSESYYNSNGYYKQLINYYANLLKYAGLLIPSTNGKSLSNSGLNKRYNNAVDYIDKMNLSIWLPRCATRALIYGTYFGLKVQVTKDTFSVIDLPVKYCRTNFKDDKGNDIIQFDINYFNTLTSEETKNSVLSLFPKEVRNAYLTRKKKSNTPWVIIPSEYGICFSMFNGYPLLTSIIPVILDYDESVILEHAKDSTEIEKIIVQHIPHLNDGRLVFEPDEAEEMHTGAVGMLKSQKNVRVLTTYGEVEAIQSSSSNNQVDEKLNRMEQNIYARAGVSGQIFAPTGSASLNVALNNDLSLMMHLANKFSLFISNTINSLFGNSNISFKYTIMPISYYNTKEFIEESFKLVNSGYSLLLPALAQGINQKDLINIKNLENDYLKLNEILIPLSTAYTQSAATAKNSSNTQTTNETDKPQQELTGEQKKQKAIETTTQKNGRPLSDEN